MELTHQLSPMLRTLRLSGVLETLEVRNRQSVEQEASYDNDSPGWVLDHEHGFPTVNIEANAVGSHRTVLPVRRMIGAPGGMTPWRTADLTAVSGRPPRIFLAELVALFLCGDQQAEEIGARVLAALRQERAEIVTDRPPRDPAALDDVWDPSGGRWRRGSARCPLTTA